jgi:hypothetical protein
VGCAEAITKCLVMPRRLIHTADRSACQHLFNGREPILTGAYLDHSLVQYLSSPAHREGNVYSCWQVVQANTPSTSFPVDTGSGRLSTSVISVSGSMRSRPKSVAAISSGRTGSLAGYAPVRSEAPWT